MSFGPTRDNTQLGGAGLGLSPLLPIVPAAMPQVQVERPQAKPRTNDLEVRRAAAILAQRGRPRWGRN